MTRSRWSCPPPRAADRAPVAASAIGGPLADRAYADLRDRILSLRLAPGEPVNEQSLCKEVGIGRTPVREAIQRLALEGLMTVHPHRGKFVSEINITDLGDICDVRRQLEGHAAQRAAQRITASQRSEARELLAELDSSGSSTDRAALLALDASAHLFVHRCAGNPYLATTLGRYLNLSRRISHLALDRLPRAVRVRDHGELLRATLDGDGNRARAVIAEHIAASEREIRAVIADRRLWGRGDPQLDPAQSSSSSSQSIVRATALRHLR